MPLALGLLEFKSVSAGVEATDAMLKAARVDLLHAGATCPGKYVSIVSGEVAAVSSAVAAGEVASGPFIVGRLVLANVHPTVLPAVTATTPVEVSGALGVLETFSIASAILAGDAAAKAADVQLIEIRVARGLGGKAFVVFTGDVAGVEAAMSAAVEPPRAEGLLTHYTVIPAPHPDLAQSLL